MKDSDNKPDNKTDNKPTKNYLNDVMSLKYSKERDLIVKKGELALLFEDYIDSKYNIEQYETRKAILEKVIEDLSRIDCI